MTLNLIWTNICTAHWLLDIYADLFINHTRDSEDIEQTQTVIQCLTLNYDLRLTLVTQMHNYNIYDRSVIELMLLRV